MARKSFVSRFRRDTGGQSALEFAMILPVFVAMVLGTIQMGMAYYTAGTVQFALEETARSYMVSQNLSAAQVQSQITQRIEAMTAQRVTVTYSLDTSGPVRIARLRAAYVVDVLIPLVPAMQLSFNAETYVPLA